MRTKRKIRRRCECGCGRITNYGRIWINGHHSTNCLGKEFSEETKKRMSLALMDNTHTLGYKHSEATKLKMSLAAKDKKHSKEHILKVSLANIKYDPNYKYCDVWKDKEYKKDIRKDYCENADCKGNYKLLCNHHIYLDKKKCAPEDIITLCNPCHAILHAKLQEGKIPSNPKDYVIINKPDHASYIHKKTHKIIKIERR